ncbi:hypothetical protein [Phenylobacterium soli]|uniref:hypothetical protein n=1 Tax=Phenylobacterium soli TaxID=2170551 RepID=UPI001401FB4C|nr:hypothetical protein [Phenylobacterium soli]
MSDKIHPIASHPSFDARADRAAMDLARGEVVARAHRDMVDQRQPPPANDRDPEAA